MQTLWSRIAQTRAACRCPQCLHSTSASGISRRAAASASRRAPQIPYSATLWYSGIFAVAATYDASVKQQRREQWNQAIAQVREELEDRAPEASEDLSMAGEGEEQDATLQELLSRVVLGRHVEEAPVSHWKAAKPSLDEPRADRIRQESEDLINALHEPRDPFDEVEPRRESPKWPANFGPTAWKRDVPPRSIYAERAAAAHEGGDQWSRKKMETVMLSIDAMQIKVWMDIGRKGQKDPTWLEDARKAVPSAYADLMAKDVKTALYPMLNDKQRQLDAMWKLSPGYFRDGYRRPDYDVPLCNYVQDDSRDFHRTSAQLNQALQDLFRAHRGESKQSTASLLARIAYNLHVSTAPPNIHTYNTLLLGFSKIPTCAELVFNVIASYRETHMRPNEVTSIAIMEHYIKHDRAQAFEDWLIRMSGGRRGLMLARSNVNIDKTSARRLVKDQDYEHVVVQLPWPTPNVFATVIKGVLKFAGFNTAMDVCERMSRDGWGLCMSGLTPLLLDCAERADWTAGLSVWQQMIKLREKSEYGRAKRQQAPILREQPCKIGLEAYAAMIRLCAQTGHRDSFQSLWDQAVRVHPTKIDALADYVRWQHFAGAADKSEPGEPVLRQASNISGLVAAQDEPLEILDEVVQSEPNGMEAEARHHLNESTLVSSTPLQSTAVDSAQDTKQRMSSAPTDQSASRHSGREKVVTLNPRSSFVFGSTAFAADFHDEGEYRMHLPLG